MRTEHVVILAGAGLIAAVMLVKKAADTVGGLTAENIVDAAANAGTVIGSAVVNAGAGVVLGVGDAVGLPRTEINACQAAIEAHRGMPWYDQLANSFRISGVCPAPDYLRFLATGGKGPLDP